MCKKHKTPFFVQMALDCNGYNIQSQYINITVHADSVNSLKTVIAASKGC